MPAAPIEPGAPDLPADGPDGQPGTHPGEDPRADLVRQLLAYKKYRDAATNLDRRLGEWESRFPGGGATVPELPSTEDDDALVQLDDVDVVDLTRAFAAIMETVDLTKVGDHRVTDDETPIELHASDILDQLRGLADELKARSADSKPEIEFRQIFTGRTRAEAIGLFLALLELIRQRQVEAVQDRINERIVLRLRDSAEAVQ
jgi:segregation and condensation protein A